MLEKSLIIFISACIGLVIAQLPGCRLPQVCPSDIAPVTNLNINLLQGRWFFYKQRDISFGFQHKNCLHMRYAVNQNNPNSFIGFQSYWNETLYRVDTDIINYSYEGNGGFLTGNSHIRQYVLDVDYSEYLILYACVIGPNNRVTKNMAILTKRHPGVVPVEVFRRIESSLVNIYRRTQFCDGLDPVNQRTPLCDPVYRT